MELLTAQVMAVVPVAAALAVVLAATAAVPAAALAAVLAATAMVPVAALAVVLAATAVVLAATAVVPAATAAVLAEAHRWTCSPRASRTETLVLGSLTATSASTRAR